MSAKTIELATGAERRAAKERSRRKRGGIVGIYVAICAVGYLLFMMVYRGCWADERDERAAYLEGRYQMDRETAVALANEGLGKSAADILAEGR